jgi:membrane-associated phospholipid phosphatase
VDSTIAAWLNAAAQHPGAQQLAEAGAQVLVALPVLIAVYLLVRSVVRRDAAALSSLVVAGIGTAVALVANVAATTWWYRARPYAVLPDVQALITKNPESSFFSDHTIVATGCAIAALLVSRRWGIAAVVAAVLVAIARVAVGAHYPTDVLTAAVVTTVAIVALLPLRSRIEAVLDKVVGRSSRQPLSAG